MGRGFALVGTLIAMTVEPTLVGEQDIVRYAITQGGLTIALLVLFGYIRYLHQERITEKEREKQERLAEKQLQVEKKEETLQAMLALVSDVKVALSRSIDITATQANAAEKTAASLQSMALALAKIEERKSQR